jgi:hypothetical protein
VNEFLARIVNRVSVWWALHRRRRRAVELRAGYLRHVAEEARSLEERVAFHLYHIHLYWSRALGFAGAARPARASFLAHTLVLLPLAASDAAAVDVRRYCAERHDAQLAAAWDQYAAALPNVRAGLPSVEAAIERASLAIDAAWQVHGGGANAANRQPWR